MIYLLLTRVFWYTDKALNYLVSMRLPKYLPSCIEVSFTLFFSIFNHISFMSIVYLLNSRKKNNNSRLHFPDPKAEAAIVP